ncbi:MAG: hypothetical protein ACLUNQ_01390 [Oscillospiraceae bacterium]
MATEQKKGFTQADIMTLLDTLYQKVLAGVPKVSVPVSAMALDYMSKHSTKEVAAKAMLKNQVIKCATSGFLTGFGGIVTLPVAIPANISSVLYVQNAHDRLHRLYGRIRPSQRSGANVCIRLSYGCFCQPAGQTVLR